MARNTKAAGSAQVKRLRDSLAREKAKSAALRKSLAEVLEQQGATSEILHAISSSPTKLQPILDAVARYAARLCEASDAFIHLQQGEQLIRAAHYGKISFGALGTSMPLAGSLAGRAFLERKQVHVRDVRAASKEFPEAASLGRKHGFRGVLVTPLMRGRVPIGVIGIRSIEVRSFTRTQLALLKSFADQAVIAIENARLFSETKEALERQTATAEILKVIASSPTDVQPVFDAIAASARRLLGGVSGLVNRVEGDSLQLVALTALNPAADKTVRDSFPRPLSGESMSAQAIRTGKPVWRADSRSHHGLPKRTREIARKRGYESILVVPMLRAGTAIGTIAVARREPGSFSNHQIELLQTFADQAVIAIENVRLFRETKEALERQTASSEILRVVARSVADAQPVFQAILASLLRLFEGFDATVWTVREGHLVSVVRGGATLDASVATRIPVAGEHAYAAALRDHKVLRLDDVTNAGDINEAARADLLGRNRKAVVLVPLLRDGNALGALSVSRATPHPFTAVQVELLKNFADQATIAIENARLFNETKDALERQTATADVLRAISTSPTDTQPVFEAILERAAKLCGAETGLLFRYTDGAFHALATRIPNPEFAATFREPRRPAPGSKTGLGQLIRLKRTVHMPDLQVDAATVESDPLRMATLRGGMRSWLGVPLLKEGELIGAIVIYGYEPLPFSQSQIALLETFAEQSVIAIENVRLFNETKEALERQTATAEILKVIAGSPTDTQPVFDTISQSASRLCESEYSYVFRFDGNLIHLVAHAGSTGESYEAMQRAWPRAPNMGTAAGRAILTRSIAHVPDVHADSAYVLGPVATAAAYRSTVAVPMLRDGVPIGTINLSRSRVGAYSDRQIGLLQTFADQAVIAIENVRLFNETKEALERQTATAEILRVIASSPDNVQPVFDAIAAGAVRLIGGFSTAVLRLDEEMVHLAAFTTTDEVGDEALRKVFPRPLSEGSYLATAIRLKVPTLTEDTETDPNVSEGTRVAAHARGWRSAIAAPMLRGNVAIGAINVTRKAPGAFSDHHIDLLKTFADQAVIAIENVRLFNETKEALERQTATAEILKVIAGSPTDVQPVFDVIVQRAVQLCDARFGRVYRYDGSIIEMVAGHGLSAKGLRQVRQVFPRAASDDTIVGRVVLTRQPFFVKDIGQDDSVPELSRQMIVALDTRSQVTVPMLRGGEPIGAITMGWDAPGAFDDQKVGLLQTFADQAVIAIENVRLFNETKESLERQTATAEILKVIAGSPADVQPVFDAIVTSGARLFGRRAVLRLAEGGQLRRKALSDPVPGNLQGAEVMSIDRDNLAGRTFLEGRPMQVVDTLAPDAPLFAQKHGREWNFRSNAAAPLLREGKAIGIISVNSPETGAMSDKQMELLQTFADQAVIAIENVRLFNETKEALERQTATADILKVIARSPSDVQPVFDAIAQSSLRLIGGVSGVVTRLVDDKLQLAAFSGIDKAAEETTRSYFPVPADRGFAGEAVRTRAPVHVIDYETDPRAHATTRELARVRGLRSVVVAPMVREGAVIGLIHVSRREPGTFTDHQIDLLKVFADQAVIAIENVRLFNETKESLERQTATAEILRVIAGSPSDVKPVFDAIAESAHRLLGGLFTVVARREGDTLHLAAHTAASASGDRLLQGLFPTRITGEGVMGRAIVTGEPVCVGDIETDPAYSEGFRKGARKLGVRGMVTVPMLREGESIGVIGVGLARAGAIAEHQTHLLKAFADQAVIAIENVRLFNETKEALERQTATSEVLNVIARSPSDVQPVLDAVAESAARLCGASDALIMTSEASMLVRRAHFGPIQSVSAARPLTRGTPTGRAVLERCTVHVEDVLAEIERGDYLEAAELQRRNGMRTILSVPLVREDSVIGVISMRRLEVRPFTEKQIALVKTFANQAVIAIENVRLFNETKESLERQTATAEILKVIASSPSDVQPVFDAIAASARRLLGGHAANVARRAGDMLELAAFTSTGEAGDSELNRLWPSKITGRGHMGKALLSAAPAWVEDIETDPGYSEEFRVGARARGMRSAVSVPMLREGEAIGVISVNRSIPGRFSDHQTNLLKTFADQAVIAIENVRLFNETKEALERQTATAEILGVIAASPTDTKPVFDAIASCGARLLDGVNALILLRKESQVVVVGSSAPLSQDVPEQNRVLPLDRERNFPSQVILDGKVLHIPDWESADILEFERNVAKAYGMKSCLQVPLLRKGEGIGAIVVSRATAGPFHEKDIALLKSFADQAVIAIENVRLFNETKEALERQTATAEILKVIASSPSDVQPVFDAIVASALKLFAGHSAVATRFADGFVHLAAYTSTGDSGDGVLKDRYPAPLSSPGGTNLDVIRTRAPVIRIDMETDPEVTAKSRETARARGYRSIIGVPMLRDDAAIGTISVTRREPGAFSAHQVSLLQTFADQAVIAIENVRLFNETKEALERQTATAEILKVIASSPSNVQPVFDAIVKSAAQLFDPWVATITILEDDHHLHWKATAATREVDLVMERTKSIYPLPFDAERSPSARAILGRKIIEIPDATAPDTPEFTRRAQQAGGFGAITFVPLTREGKGIGTIILTHPQPGSKLTDKQLALVQTFADQAVIAIENVRLFKELETRTNALGESVQKLTALGEVGQAISSTLDLEIVLKTIATHAVQLTGLDGASIYEYDEANEEFRLQVADKFPEEFLQAIRSAPIRKGDGTVGKVANTLEPIQVPDILDKGYRSSRKDLLVAAGYRAILTVPLLREGHIIGALNVTRKTPGPFGDEVVELLKTFATQSAMAIQNARLFREIAEKGKQLEEASRHKSQFLASMSHELRTPLNAILGFNEMILGDIYGEVPGDMKEPLTDIQTSGKHLLRLINNVLDLAKIEAGRMELALDDYSVHDTVESVRSTLRPLAEAKGLELAVDVPSDIPLAHGDGGRITQCLMNLAGNSLKFTKQGSVGISVVLSNGTLTYQVKDTGMGIPADKIGSLFTEFKQTDATIASEFGGTGLGLSITKKFIEMHGGRIWAESEPGSGSTFIFEIPLRAEEAGET